MGQGSSESQAFETCELREEVLSLMTHKLGCIVLHLHIWFVGKEIKNNAGHRAIGAASMTS
jgi:hypothetical protein